MLKALILGLALTFSGCGVKTEPVPYIQAYPEVGPHPASTPEAAPQKPEQK